MQFTVSFDPDSPDLALLTSAEHQAVLETANAAAAIWARYLTSANITLDLQITIDNSLYGGSTLAIGGPSDLYATGDTFNGEAVYEAGPSSELRTGQDPNGSDADLVMGLTVDAIRNSFFFKTDQSAAVPAGKYDALSIFLHEIGHGLGIIYTGVDADFSGIGIFDTFVQNGEFTGTNAIIAYQRISGQFINLPLEAGNLSHLRESSSLGTDLLSPAISSGTNILISAVDLGILRDIGVAIALPTSGNDNLYAVPQTELRLGAGHDTGTAIFVGSTIYGEAGDDRLRGDKARDYLYGGDGNDFLTGGGGDDQLEGDQGDDLLQGDGGNDTLNAGYGTDTAIFSGLASDYQIVRGQFGSIQVIDLRSGSPDGTDTLTEVERAQWSDGSITYFNSPPVLTTANIRAYRNTTIALSSLFSVTDAEGDAISAYQLLDSSPDPASGHFVVGGIARAAGTIITISASELAQAYFVTGTTGDNLQIRAFDGHTWSAADNAPWAPFTVSIANAAPVLTTESKKLVRNTTVALSSLFSVSDLDGDAITKYQLWDATSQAGSGYFVVNGIAQAALTVIEVTAAQLSQTYFVAGSTTTDNLQIRAFDGQNWSADNSPWAPFTITLGDPPPIVSASDVTKPTNQSIALSSLFSASDPNGKAITMYQIWDGNPSPQSGYFIINGVLPPPYSTVTISSAEMAQTYFVTGTSKGDTLRIRAFNGDDWSSGDDWNSPDIEGATGFNITLSGPLNNRPELTLGTKAPGGSFLSPIGFLTAPQNQTLATSVFSHIYDADGDAITTYQLLDTTTDAASGHWAINGVAQAAGVILTLTPAQWAQTQFVTGTVGDDLQMRVSDGKNWSTSYRAGYGIEWVPADVAWATLKISIPNSAPTVTTSNRTQRHFQVSPLSSLFSANDPNGDAITKYQLWDANTDPASGHFVVNGAVQSAGKIIEITAAQLPQTSFVAGTVGDDLQIRAFDGTEWSAGDNAAWALFRITVSPNSTPVVTTSNWISARDDTLPLLSLASVSDADSDAITKYQLWDAGRDSNSGYFMVNGAKQTAGTVIEITAAQFYQTVFVVGQLSDSLQVRAFDGFGWSAGDNAAWAPFTVSPGINHAPLVTTNNVSRTRNTSLALSSLFSSGDADLDTITKYQLWDASREATSGYFTVDDVKQAAGTIIEISAAQMAQTSFVTGTTGDSLQIRAFDGIDWSAGDNAAWAPFTVTVPTNNAPVVTTSDTTKARLKSIALSSLFSVSDIEGDTITRYQLWDASREATSGYFTINGVKQAAGTIIEISAAQLAQTSFVTGTTGDNLQIRAFDGTDWSAGDNAAWAPFTITPGVNHAPVVNTANLTWLHERPVSLQTLFSLSDNDGDAMTRYQLWDSTPDASSGYFRVGGAIQAAGTVIEITAAQLGHTVFFTGTTSDSLQIRAFDGIDWSAGDSAAWAPFTVTVPANSAPVVTTGTVNAMHGRTLALSSLISVNDADGDVMTRYQLWDASREASSGTFTINGVAQAAGTVIEVSAAQLAQTAFVTGTTGDSLQIRTFDGYAWSAGDSAAWSPFNVAVTPYTAPTLATTDKAATAGQNLSLSSLISVTDTDGDTMTRYQLWDSSHEAGSGHWMINNVAQNAGTVIDITAAQLAQTSFLAGALGDSLQVRAFDGISWTAADNAAWAPFHVGV